LAATVAGCTVAANADSKIPATALACAAAPDALAAAVLNHPVYGAAAAVMAADAGPCHDALASPDVTDPNEAAAEPNSPARPSQAAAADSIGAEPAPENISEELISGGSTEKFITAIPSRGYKQFNHDRPLLQPQRNFRQHLVTG
jgi:hypothetical protein